MELILENALSTSAEADENDVRAAKIALNRLGYYTPEYAGGINDVTDAKLFAAIKTFQEDSKLQPSGAIRPQDETVAAINRAIEDQPIAQEYIWRTAGDDKVRSDHQARDGKRFSWLQRPLPGEEHNCRCWAEPVIGKQTINQIYDPPIEPVYLVETALGLTIGSYAGLILRLPTIKAPSRNLNIEFNPAKSIKKWTNQLRERGWENDDEVVRALNEGKRYQVLNKAHPDHLTIMYKYNRKYLVRDEVTNKIIHVGGGKDFKPPKIIGWIK